MIGGARCTKVSPDWEAPGDPWLQQLPPRTGCHCASFHDEITSQYACGCEAVTHIRDCIALHPGYYKPGRGWRRRKLAQHPRRSRPIRGRSFVRGRVSDFDGNGVEGVFKAADTESRTAAQSRVPCGRQKEPRKWPKQKHPLKNSSA